MKNSDKEKYVYSGYGIAFDGKCSWSYYAKNVIIFGIDSSSSSHADNQKNDFLVLDERDTFGINRKFGAPEKKLALILVKQRQFFFLSLHYNDDNSYLFVNGKEIYKFKANN